MKLWAAFWAYWKWFCTALVTSAAVLFVIAALLGGFSKHEPDYKNLIDECIDNGGAWDDEAGACKNAA